MNRDLQQLLSQGGDERIHLDQHGRNKYYLNPAQYHGIVHRGSCTCNHLTALGFEQISHFLQNGQHKDFCNWIATQRNRLKALIDVAHSKSFEVYFAPSGSDLMYYPLLFLTAIHPRQSIINIVSCPQELGSGSRIAARAQYFSRFNQFGKPLPQQQFLSDSIKSEVVFLSARDEQGLIYNRKPQIRKIIHDNATKQQIVVNLVYGSKSGIMDDLSIIDEFTEGILWVVDICQFRADPELINSLLKKRAMVMITGSKFYQSPPFCAAMLVPAYWHERLCQAGSGYISAFSGIFSYHDFPPSVAHLLGDFPTEQNLGLHLRWEIALNEMERYARLDNRQVLQLIDQWHRFIVDRLSQSPFFAPMPDMSKTNLCIVSFKCLAGRREDKTNYQELNLQQLRLLFKHLVNRKYFRNNQYLQIFIGQPVSYGNKSFLRLAIGSDFIARQLARKNHDFSDDEWIIQQIEQAVEQLFQ